MSYYLGFDGGGSKTDCVVLNAEGKLLGQGSAGPSNPLRIGFDAAFAALAAAAEQALAAASGARADNVAGVCAGLAGAGRTRVVKRVMAYLVEAFPRADVHVTSDIDIAMETALGEGPGVVLIAGTGSAACGRSSTGRTARAGGWGPWIGDEGSGFDVGRKAVGAVARARDRLGPVTVLSDMISSALDCPSWDVLSERVAAAPDDVFPRIYPLVVEAAENDDATARELLFGAALSLSRLASSVVRRLHLSDKEFPLVKTGGVFGRSKLLDSAVDALLGGVAPRARLERLNISTAIGAARLALRETGGAKAAHGAKD